MASALQSVTSLKAYDFPREVRIFAVETMNKNVIGEKPSESVMQAIPELIRLVRRQIQRWRMKEAAHA